MNTDITAPLSTLLSYFPPFSHYPPLQPGSDPSLRIFRSSLYSTDTAQALRTKACRAKQAGMVLSTIQVGLSVSLQAWWHLWKTWRVYGASRRGAGLGAGIVSPLQVVLANIAPRHVSRPMDKFCVRLQDDDRETDREPVSYAIAPVYAEPGSRLPSHCLSLKVEGSHRSSLLFSTCSSQEILDTSC